MKRFQLLNVTIFVAMFFLALSCDNIGNKKADEAKTTTQETASTAMDVDVLLTNAADFVGKEVEVEGICTHICKHGARKIFLMGETNSIRVEGGEVGKFDQKCVNSIVNVIGTLEETRIDEAYLQKWEAKIAAEVKENHGDGENGCDAEKNARKEKGNSPQERIDNFRKQIEDGGKDYISFYHINALSYEIQ